MWLYVCMWCVCLCLCCVCVCVYMNVLCVVHVPGSSLMFVFAYVCVFAYVYLCVLCFVCVRGVCQAHRFLSPVSDDFGFGSIIEDLTTDEWYVRGCRCTVCVLSYCMLCGVASCVYVIISTLLVHSRVCVYVCMFVGGDVCVW